MAYLSIDIDIDDILSECGRYDEKRLLEGLLEQMDPEDVLEIIKQNKDYKDVSKQVASVVLGDDISFANACERIKENRWRLPLDQEQIILEIASKL